MKHQFKKFPICAVISLFLSLLFTTTVLASAPQQRGTIDGDAVKIEKEEKEEEVKEESVREEGEKAPEAVEREEEGISEEEEIGRKKGEKWYKKYWWIWICPGFLILIGLGLAVYYLVEWIRSKKK